MGVYWKETSHTAIAVDDESSFVLIFEHLNYKLAVFCSI